MRIALIGYGKMGKTIERIAIERGHTISAIIDVHNKEDIKKLNGSVADVAIEFSQPESAFSNISHCIENNLPIVSGTTGWLTKKPVLDIGLYLLLPIAIITHCPWPSPSTNAGRCSIA